MAALDPAKREYFLEHGYVLIENAVDERLLAQLQRDFDGWVKESRRHADAYGDTLDGRPRFDLEPGHTAQTPGQRRVSAPVEVSEAYLTATANSRMTDCVAELIGPNVKLHHTKINSKLPGGRTEDRVRCDYADRRLPDPPNHVLQTFFATPFILTARRSRSFTFV